MSIQTSSTSFPYSSPQWKYDVFLSFRGEDTRKAFTDHLYTTLEHRGIITFRDDPELQKGEAISPALFAAIEESRFAIIVLSQNYASSTWCLDELVKILQCMKARGRVLPIFYDVDPSDVRKQTGSFREAFANHEQRFWDDNEKVQRWRTALTEVASFSGWSSKEWYESRLIRDIVEVIWTKLKPTSFSYAENLVGMNSRLQPVNLLLGVGVDDVRFIGIWGMGGIGKTTMVTAVYERISHQFEFSFLLTDVRKSVEKGCLLNLQKQLVSGMIRTKQADHICDVHEGATIIRRLFGHKKVLLILDDVNHSSHLKYLAGKQEWFGSGSRVLITTINEHLLIEHEVERRLKVEELSDDDSLQLFSWKAFKRGYPEENFLCLSKSVIKYAKGLPLALEVLGSSLYGRSLSEWNSTLRKLGRVCNLEIFDILKISYNDLDSEEKTIFLDIACFFNGQDEDRVTEVLTSSDISATIGIKVLMEKSLLTVLNGTLWMHDLLREMGHEIVRLESPDKPGRRSRLWLLDDVKHVLTQNTGTEAIEGIVVDSTESDVEVEVTPKSFSLMHKLRYLKIKSENLPKEFEYLPNSLRILDWTRYPSTSLLAHFYPQKLFQLTLCHSCLKNVQIGKEPLKKLKTINLSHSLNLVNTPNFKGVPYLEFLILEGCIRLYKVDPGIEVLEKLPDELGHGSCLQKLDVSGSGISDVPSCAGHLKNLEVLSLAGCKGKSLQSWNMMFNLVQLLRKRSHIPPALSLSCLSGLHSLTELNLPDCNLSEEAIPRDFGCLTSLRDLDLCRNQFIRLPESIGQLPRLEGLYLDGCRKLQILPEFSSYVWVRGVDCISLDTLTTQTGQCKSLLQRTFINCFKMVEKESCNSFALPLLTRYLESRKAFSDHQSRFHFVGPGNEIPEWYNHQSVGSSVTVELHPGWFTEKFVGLAFCVVFRCLKPLLRAVRCKTSANGRVVRDLGLGFKEEWGQPVSFHTWFCFIPHNDEFVWRDIYYQLESSFSASDEKVVQVNQCGVRVVYEDDVKELWQTLPKQSNTKRGLQLSDCNDAAFSSESQAHPKRFKLHLEGAGPSGTHNLFPSNYT